MFINHSRIKTYQNCPRKYYWLYEFDGLGLEKPYKDEKLLFGTIIHAGLAEMYNSGIVDLYYGAMCRSLEEEFPDRDPQERELWDYNMKWAGQLLDDYCKNVYLKDDFSVLNIETSFAVPLGEHTYVGRIDLIINQNGVIRILDHKTTGSSSKLYLESWHYSNQMVGYVYGASAASGHTIRGYTVNILRKLKSIGNDRKTDKTCSECKNGSRKKLTCEKCSGLGKVPLSREELVKQNPFQREVESVGVEDIKRWEHSRLDVISRIEQDKKDFNQNEDLVKKAKSFPKNEENCFNFGRCPFIRLSNETDPEKWWNPAMELLVDFDTKNPDYVNDAEKMQKEELR